MRRRAWLWLLAAASCLPACGPHRPGLPPRHLVLLTFDGLRADHLSCYAYSRPTSRLPSDEVEHAEGRAFSLDDLAASGVVFAHAYAPSPLTLPSLATLFTGRPPVETGVLDERSRLPRDVPTLAELAHAAGFRSAAFVSQRTIDVLDGVGRGFDEAHWAKNDGDALALARAWLARDFGDGERVFLWIHLSGLETPWEPIPEAEIERPEMSPTRFLDPDYHGPADGSPEFFARVRSGEPPLAPAERAALVELYDGRVAATTGRMSSFLAAAFDFNRRGAETTEFWARTLLVVTATHGFLLGEPGGRLPAELRDELLAVPLILRHPDSLTGERVLAAPVELGDLLPTLVETLGLPRPRGLGGRSLLSLTDAHPAHAFEARSVVTQSSERIFSARDGRWRLVWNPYRSHLAPDDPHRALPLVALYDPTTRASGDANLAAQYPDVVTRLQQEVKDWITRQRFRASLPLEPVRVPETPPPEARPGGG